MNTRNLKKYAKTIVKIGANIKRGTRCSHHF